MSVSVLFNGQKKSIKVSPMQPMQYVVNEAAASFSVLPDRYCLKHKKVTVDPSQPFRFTGLANNVVLELCLRVNECNPVNITTKIAANIQPYGTFTDSFASTSSLIEILQHFISKESLPEELLLCNPEIIYLRNSYTGDNLNENRLNTLGLAGQNAKFQIRFKKNLNDILSSTSSVPLKPLDTKDLTVENSNDKMIIEGNESAHSSLSSESTKMIAMDTATTTSSIEQTYEDEIKSNNILTDKMSSHTITTISPTVSDNNYIRNEIISTTSTTSSSINSSDHPAVSFPSTPGYVVDTSPASTILYPHQQIIPMEVETDPGLVTESPNLHLPFPTPALSSSSISSLLLALSTMVENYEACNSRSDHADDDQSNEDRDRFVQALRTLFKGAQDFLLAIGFLLVDKAVEVDAAVEGKAKGDGYRSNENTNRSAASASAAEEWLVLPLLPIGPLSVDAPPPPQHQPVEGPVSDALRLLEAAADHFNFPLASAQSQPRSTAAAAAAPAFVFDPFKPAIFRTNPQPRDNANLSVTDMRLQSLLKKRADILASTSSSSSPGDLLASIQTMDHCTTVVSFPGSSSSSSSTTVRDEEEEDTATAASRGDNRLIAQALAKKVAAAAAADRDQDEGPPLTTSALREVWALEKARVYSTVLVRVSFPDRVVLQGTFHPESQWRDILAWLARDCLRDSAPHFELSCSDPSLRLKRKPDDEESDQRSLSELGLVPAALLRLKWREDEEVTAESTGSYLKDSLLLAADGKQMSSASATASYPTGISLVGQRKDTKDTKKELGIGSAATTTQPGVTASEPKKSGGGRPKWFKT